MRKKTTEKEPVDIHQENIRKKEDTEPAEYVDVAPEEDNEAFASLRAEFRERMASHAKNGEELYVRWDLVPEIMRGEKHIHAVPDSSNVMHMLAQTTIANTYVAVWNPTPDLESYEGGFLLMFADALGEGRLEALAKTSPMESAAALLEIISSIEPASDDEQAIAVASELRRVAAGLLMHTAHRYGYCDFAAIGNRIYERDDELMPFSENFTHAPEIPPQLSAIAAMTLAYEAAGGGDAPDSSRPVFTRLCEPMAAGVDVETLIKALSVHFWAQTLWEVDWESINSKLCADFERAKRRAEAN